MQILGFPVQLIGVAALPYFYVKYVIEGDSLVDDVGAAAVTPIHGQCQESCYSVFSCVHEAALLICLPISSSGLGNPIGV